MSWILQRISLFYYFYAWEKRREHTRSDYRGSCHWGEDDSAPRGSSKRSWIQDEWIFFDTSLKSVHHFLRDSKQGVHMNVNFNESFFCLVIVIVLKNRHVFRHVWRNSGSIQSFWEHPLVSRLLFVFTVIWFSTSCASLLAVYAVNLFFFSFNLFF